ncbi:MAG TPA: ABC transporter substrate-binding protein, partial [Geminicoccaceae bacterium]|nr:ABC transporter substrate-binding protein [Geminicoccaceae bacterium]
MTKHDETLARLARAGLDRRGLLHGAGALALATGFGGVLPRAARAQAAPARGGHLKLGIDSAGATDSLDPATYTAWYMQVVGFQWGNCLVELNEKVEAVPELAVSWDPSDDAKTWVFKLRKGVTFTNGKELTAADVVYSINHHRGEASKSGASGYLTMISDVKATAPDEVTFVLSSPYADMP